MDVHAPHQPVHTWRDFAIHLTIVTIGLFIALSLEGMIEYVHHRHLVHEARTNIRQEIADNHKALQEDFRLVQKAQDAQNNNLTTIRGLIADPKGTKRVSLDYTISFDQPDESAWLSARDTGALAFMPYSEVKNYSALYATQTIVNREAIDILHNVEVAYVPMIAQSDPIKMPPADQQQMLHNTATNFAELDSLKQLLKELDAQYMAELK